jgi:hypothetical protein
VVDREGKALWRGSSSTTPEDIAAAVRAHAPGAVRIGFETGALSTWLWHGLKKIGLPIVCLDARHAKAVLSMQVNKSDRNDAFGLGKHFSIAVVSCQASSSPFVHFPTVIVHRLARFSLLSEVGAMAAT